jgi:hypothetical protein
MLIGTCVNGGHDGAKLLLNTDCPV